MNDNVKPPVPLPASVQEEKSTPVELSSLQCEYSLLRKLIYKNRNQHRSTKYFKSMNMLGSTLNRVLNGMTEIAIEFSKLNSMLLRCKTGKEIDHAALDAFFNGKFAGFIESCRKAKIRSFHAVRQFTSLVRTRYFLPFAVICLACISKIGVLIMKLFNQLYFDMFYSLSGLWLGRVRDLCGKLENAVDLANFAMESIQRARNVIKQFENNEKTTKKQRVKKSVIPQQIQIDNEQEEDFGEIVTL